MAAAWVKRGDKVLDVGCGYASFRGAVPEASYTGLDPNFAEADPLKAVRNQTLEDHLQVRRALMMWFVLFRSWNISLTRERFFAIWSGRQNPVG